MSILHFNNILDLIDDDQISELDGFEDPYTLMYLMGMVYHLKARANCSVLYVRMFLTDGFKTDKQNRSRKKADSRKSANLTLVHRLGRL